MDLPVDITSLLRCVHRQRISLRDESGVRPLPAWADWLIWLGQWMRCQAAMSGRRMAIVRLPTRRIAGPFVALGAMFSAARLHDESLDWSTLQALPRDAVVHWREQKGGGSANYSGRIESVREISGEPYLAISIETPRKSKGAIFLLPRATALSYGVRLGAVSARTEKQLTASAMLLRSVVDDASLAWIRSTNPDSTLITERSTTLNDLSEIAVATGPTCVVPFTDVLAFSDPQERKHGKTLLLPVRSELSNDAPEGVTILDGPAAISRLAHARARSLLVLLDYAEYDEVVMHDLFPFMGSAVAAGLHPLGGSAPTLPAGVEIFAFGLPNSNLETG